MTTFAKKRRQLKILRLMLAFYKPHVYRPILALSMFIALVSCTKDSDSSRDNPPAGDNAGFLAEAESTADAEPNIVDLPFKVKAPNNSIQLVATSDGRSLRLVELEGPGGEFYFDSTSASDIKFSKSGEFQNSPNTFNYPQLASQKALQAGDYRARYELVPLDEVVSEDTEVAPDSVKLEVLSKADEDFSRGTINLNAVLSGSAGGNKNSRDAIERSIEIARQMLDRYGISLHVELHDIPELPETLPDPEAGDVVYEELGGVTEEGVNIYFVSEAEGLNGQPYVSGKAGASPGALVPSVRSAIVISINDAAAGDGLFDSDDTEDSDELDDSEVRLLAENVAHEVLRYAGLPDTVTFSGSTVVDSDGLNSQKCPSLEACEENDGANGNIMFPFPLSDDDSDEEKYFPRDRLSSEQVELVQRSVAID